MFVHYTKTIKRFIVNFFPVQKQSDGYNCGTFAIAFTAEILDGTPPTEECFNVQRMQGHLINCLENKVPIPFMKVWSHLNVWGAAIEKYSR